MIWFVEGCNTLFRETVPRVSMKIPVADEEVLGQRWELLAPLIK